MTENEFNNILFPKDLWFSPSWVIDTFDYYVNHFEQVCGDRIEALSRVIKHRNAKKLREMWASAVFLLGYEKMTANSHWLQPCYDTSPDTLGVCFIKSKRVKNSNDQAQIFIEITEWDKNTTDGLAERILSKLSGKAYPDYYHLVVHITRLGDLNTDMDVVSEILAKSKLKVAGVWIVASSHKQKAENNYIVAWLFPQKAKYEFSLSELLKEDRDNKIPPVLSIVREKGLGFRELGIRQIEIPALD